MTPSVAFDVTPLVGPRTGIGLSVAEMLSALAELDDPPRIVPFAYGASIDPGRDGSPPDTRRLRAPTRLLLQLWGRGEMPRIERVVAGARIVHATAFVAPPSRLPTVVTVHDCAFARIPETEPRWVRGFGRILRRAVARGAWIHTATDAVAEEVEELVGVSLRREGRTRVIPFGVPTLGGALSLPSELEARLSGEPYILAIGSLVPRKNIPTLVRAFGALEDRRVRLVLAGADGPDRPAIDRAIASLPPTEAQRVVLTGWVDEGTRRTLMERAVLLAYPSRYEGFGFPMLEAMTLRVPVVASDLPALREVAGDAAEFVDPNDEASLSASLARVLDDGGYRDALIQLGVERAGRYTWHGTAEGLAELYRHLSEEAISS